MHPILKNDGDDGGNVRRSLFRLLLRGLKAALNRRANKKRRCTPLSLDVRSTLISHSKKTR